MVKIMQQQGHVRCSTTVTPKRDKGKPVVCDTGNIKVNPREEQHIRKIARSIIRIHREALQELEKY